MTPARDLASIPGEEFAFYPVHRRDIKRRRGVGIGLEVMGLRLRVGGSGFGLGVRRRVLRRIED